MVLPSLNSIFAGNFVPIYERLLSYISGKDIDSLLSAVKNVNAKCFRTFLKNNGRAFKSLVDFRIGQNWADMNFEKKKFTLGVPEKFKHCGFSHYLCFHVDHFLIFR